MKRLKLLTKVFLTLGVSMLIIGRTIGYFFQGLCIEPITTVFYHILIHLGIMTIAYGRICLSFEVIKYKESKCNPNNDQPYYAYIITFLIIQLLGYGLDIDILKTVVIKEGSSTSVFPGVPLISSLIVGSIVCYCNN